MPVAHTARTDGIAFFIHVTPGARRASVGNAHGDALRIAVQAPRALGRASEACVEALAVAFGVRRAAVAIERGALSRRKRVSIAGEPGSLASRLKLLAGES